MADRTAPPDRWDDVDDHSPIPVDSAYPAPLRIQDGLISSVLSRPVWSLAVGRLAAAGFLAEVVAIAATAGKRAVALGRDGFEATGVETVGGPDLRSLPGELGIGPALIAHVGVSRTDDGVAALSAGFKPILIGADCRMRGAVVVPDVAALDALVRGRHSSSVTSTYHES